MRRCAFDGNSGDRRGRGGERREMPRLLLIEDDPSIRRLVTLALEDAGFEIAAAENGAAGLASFGESTPDIVVLDLSLPDMHGFEVCEQIRERGDTPVLILTASSRDEQVLEGFRRGADDYLTKPFSVRVFTARLDALLRRRPRRPLT